MTLTHLFTIVVIFFSCYCRAMELVTETDRKLAEAGTIEKLYLMAKEAFFLSQSTKDPHQKQEYFLRGVEKFAQTDLRLLQDVACCRKPKKICTNLESDIREQASRFGINTLETSVHIQLYLDQMPWLEQVTNHGLPDPEVIARYAPRSGSRVFIEENLWQEARKLVIQALREALMEAREEQNH